jgi:phosphoribosylamine--glycine ligase
MREAGTPFRGCLYCGLMMTEKGPKVLEYNCRFGDPEAQVTIPLIDGDFFKLLYSIALGKLDRSQAKLHNASAVCVVMASNGYPDDYKTGFEIQGKLNYVPEEGVVIFHSGTKREGEKLLTAGGRVLGVTAVGRRSDLEETICNAYTAVRQITFDGAYFRSDIGKKSLSIT